MSLSDPRGHNTTHSRRAARGGGAARAARARAPAVQKGVPELGGAVGRRPKIAPHEPLVPRRGIMRAHVFVAVRVQQGVARGVLCRVGAVELGDNHVDRHGGPVDRVQHLELGALDVQHPKVDVRQAERARERRRRCAREQRPRGNVRRARPAPPFIFNELGHELPNARRGLHVLAVDALAHGVALAPRRPVQPAGGAGRVAERGVHVDRLGPVRGEQREVDGVGLHVQRRPAEVLHEHVRRGEERAVERARLEHDAAAPPREESRVRLEVLALLRPRVARRRQRRRVGRAASITGPRMS